MIVRRGGERRCPWEAAVVVVLLLLLLLFLWCETCKTLVEQKGLMEFETLKGHYVVAPMHLS